MKFLHSEKAPAAIGPYSQATAANKTIYVSGQLPIVDGELQTDIKKATRASLDNILHIIETEGAKIENIARVGVFMKDLSQFADMNEVYADFFKDHKPARSAVQVAALPKDAIIEIEAIVVLD